VEISQKFVAFSEYINFNLLDVALGSMAYQMKWSLPSLKVRKCQNENMKSSYCPKYERKKLKNSALKFRA
jgi:hypothetical protein